MVCSTFKLILLLLFILFIAASGAIVASDINVAGADTNVVKLEAFSHCVEIVYIYRSGNTTVMIATINPHVLFSYRNVHLIRFVTEPGKSLKLFDEIVESPRPAIGILYQRANILRRRLASIGIDSPLRIEGLFIVVDLSGKPVDLVARAVWEVFRDLDTTVIILDEKLASIRRVYSDIYEYYVTLPRNASEYAEQIRAIIVQAEKSSEEIPGCRIWTAGHGYAISPLDGYEYPYLGKVIVNNTYNNCKPVIDRFVVEMADLIRKHISEDIPMYVVLYEHSWIGLPLETPTVVEMPRTVEMPSEPNYSLQQAIGALLVVIAVSTVTTVIVRRRVK